MESQDSVANARKLVAQILEDARARDYKTLLDVDADAETWELLDLVSDSTAQQARQHLKAARGWKARQVEKSKGKLESAQTALNRLDLDLARGILRKIDVSLLDDSDLVRYDELLLATEARAVELENIMEGVPSPPPEKKKRRRPFPRL